MYLGRESGFVPTGIRSFAIDRGLLTLISDGENNSLYELACLSFWMRSDQTYSTFSHKVYELQWGTSKISLMATALANDDERAVITVVDENGDPYTGLSFYQNGLYVTTPIVSRFEWMSLSMYLVKPITTSERIYTKVYPGAVYNNISYFPPDSLARSTRIDRTWDEIDNLDWADWIDDDTFDYVFNDAPIDGFSSWYGALFPGPTSTSLSNFPTRLHNSYIGKGFDSVQSKTSVEVSQGPVSTQSNVAAVTYLQEPA